MMQCKLSPFASWQFRRWLLQARRIGHAKMAAYLARRLEREGRPSEAPAPMPAEFQNILDELQHCGFRQVGDTARDGRVWHVELTREAVKGD